MIEAAFITPVFFLIVFGLLEYGLVMRDNLTVAAMTRDTARGASAFGNEQYADFKSIRIAGATARALPLELLERIVIYDAGSVNGDITSPSHPAHGCMTSADGITNVCNVYTLDDLAKPQSAYGCNPTTGEDRKWCPAALNGQDGREIRQSGPPDYIGVWVKVRHPFLTGLFGDEIHITDSVVMRMEPREE